MNVNDVVNLGDGHLIEIGDATWDESSISVRNRYPTSNGGFSPRSSSEIPLGDVEHIVRAVGERDLLEIAECARIIEVLSASISRRA